MKPLKVNYLAVIVLTVAHQITNFVWYMAIGQEWMRLSGITMEQAQQSASPVPYLMSMVAAFLACYMIARLFVGLNIRTLGAGALYAIGLYASFLLFQVTTKDMFQLRPFQLTMLNEGINAINFTLAGAVLGAWKQYASE